MLRGEAVVSDCGPLGVVSSGSSGCRQGTRSEAVMGAKVQPEDSIWRLAVGQEVRRVMTQLAGRRGCGWLAGVDIPGHLGGSPGCGCLEGVSSSWSHLWCTWARELVGGSAIHDGLLPSPILAFAVVTEGGEMGSMRWDWALGSGGSSDGILGPDGPGRDGVNADMHCLRSVGTG